MKSRLIQLMICGGAAIAFAAAAIAQDAGDQAPPQQAPAQSSDAPAQPSDAPAQPSQAVVATRPSNMETPTSRPERSGLGDGQLESRQQRRERRFQQQRQSGFGGTALNSSANGSQPLYETVGARNIFIRGDQEPPQSFGAGSGPSAAEQARTAERTAQADLVLTGVSLADNGKIALVENHSDYSVQQLKLGDKIANGTVVNVTFNSLDYKNSAGQVIRVQVGSNLAGGEGWGVVDSSSSSTTASTRPAAGGPRMPGESMEDYLKRRRSAELTH